MPTLISSTEGCIHMAEMTIAWGTSQVYRQQIAERQWDQEVHQSRSDNALPADRPSQGLLRHPYGQPPFAGQTTMARGARWTCHAAARMKRGKRQRPNSVG